MNTPSAADRIFSSRTGLNRRLSLIGAIVLWGVALDILESGSGENHAAAIALNSPGLPVYTMSLPTSRAPYCLFSEKWQSKSAKAFNRAKTLEKGKKIGIWLFAFLMGICSAAVMLTLIYIGAALLGLAGLVIMTVIGGGIWGAILFRIFRKRYPDMEKGEIRKMVLLGFLLVALCAMLFFI